MVDVYKNKEYLDPEYVLPSLQQYMISMLERLLVERGYRIDIVRAVTKN